jgi:putative flippase GtrA
MNLTELPVARMLTVLRSAAVGVLATAADLVALAVLVDGVGLSPRLANLPALAIGIAVQFAGNKWFAFGDRSPDWARQGARIATTSIVYFCICLPLWSRIFRDRTGQRATEQEPLS